MLELFPEIKPFKTFMLPVSHGHTLYVECSGTPTGIPVIYLHGGPGGGSYPNFRRLFNPELYFIVSFDQRGAGLSTPHASIENNTLPLLIEDIEEIRQSLGVDSWLVSGGSWGSTLSLAYAKAHKKRVLGLILRGLFLCRPSEIHWMYQHGASEIFPDIWERFLAPLTEDERNNCLQAYYAKLTSTDKAVQLEAALAWSCWEFAIMSLIQNRNDFSAFDEKLLIAMARIECHYFVNNIFLPEDSTLLDGLATLDDIPTILIQGRYDIICPTRTAWDVHKRISGSELHIIPDAGHSYLEPGIVDAFIAASEGMAKRLRPQVSIPKNPMGDL